MTKYILHGGFTRVENESNTTFFKEFLHDAQDGSTVLFVYFASRSDDDARESFGHHVTTCREIANGKRLNYKQATRENFITELTEASAIFFNGGSTNKLLEILRSYGDLKAYMEGKTVAGSSAGMYALVRYGTSHDEAVIREGLGFVPVRGVAHYESEKLPPNADSLRLLEQTHEELPLVCLKDFEWKICSV